jgi:hypothetical protein
VIGQAGVCYKVLRNFDQGSYGAIYNSNIINNSREISVRNANRQYELIIKTFDTRYEIVKE